MKKSFLSILCTLTALLALSGCTSDKPAASSAADDKIKITVTVFPEYDWVRNILQDRADEVDLTLLMKNGADLHNYQPSADDIMKIADSDLFIYIGGESDEWVNGALKNKMNPDMIELNLLDILGSRAKEEEIVEGMEAEEEEEAAYDEHIWLSLRNAETLCSAITDAISTVDPDHAEEYSANLSAYQQKLHDLDQEYADAVSSSSYHTLLFGDRFPFRYMVDDYGLDYYAAFVGCSAETEASFETIIFLADKVNELDLHSVCKIESSDGSIADTVVSNTTSKNQKILTFDSMQSVTRDRIDQGDTYLTIMQGNLEVLKEALK